jgi:two-component system, sensor histidine kinase
MHPLLARQIADCTGPDGRIDRERLTGLISDAYDDEERARGRLERAMRLMDEEMSALNKQIATQAQESVTRFILGAPYPLAVTTAGGTVILPNRELAAAIGCCSRDLVGSALTDLLDDSRPVEEMVARVDVHSRVRRRDGSGFAAALSFTRAQVSDQTFLVVSIRDETGRLAQMEAMEAARAAAEAANNAKSAFLAMMSHELRTPLNALMGSADLLARTDLDSRQASYVRMFTEAGQLMLALLNDVLDYSKIEAGQLELELAPFEPGRMLEELAGLWGPQAQARGLKLSVGPLPPGLPPALLGDGMRLRQILFNLVSNAIKFTAKGRVCVDSTAQEIDGDIQLEIRVSDTGIGIPQDRLASIFSPFVQADSSVTRRYGGTGLGLSIARSLARQMGGDLSVTSVEGKGSCFTLMVRLSPAQMDQSAPDAPEASAVTALRVLAVDDNPLNRRILAAFLELWPVSTSWATNGVEALDLLAQDRFDVVLMDVQMPVMDGLTATRRLRARGGPNRDVPVLALTANAREEDRQACLAAGMDDFLTKPIRPDALLEALSRVEAQAAPGGEQATACA